MGVVYTARQASMNREVAIKMVKPERADSASASEALMSEAVVTGCLDHPNVVPVYDLGVDGEGRLFYAMKEVEGFPWSALIGEKTLDENLDILLRVADTIAFAHSKNILHRDLKPQNIMLGAFGEIMVMDWGAACTLSGSNVAGIVPTDTAYCGTPAYMAPEMAKADKNRMGVGSDVYLLGAILYHILTGRPPRSEKNPIYCLEAAAENHIDPVDEDGELQRIALKAMAAAPADRYRTVEEFQQAIRDYRSHSESLTLLASAKENLAQAKKRGDYNQFNQAIYGLREALTLWPENPDAQPLLEAATLDHARCAIARHDYELAQSLLDQNNPAHVGLLNEIQSAIRERDSRKNRLRKLLLTARLLLVTIAVLFGVGFFMIRAQQKETEVQRQKAANEHRHSLINLISAHYGEQNYEATVAAFWQLHDQYGMDGLDEETLLNIRVAANMNPYRGSIVTSMAEPLGIMQAVESNCVWVVGKRKMKKIRLAPDVGYDSETVVAVHDFNFGKRKAPGKVVESIKVPFELMGCEAVHEAGGGTLWAGSGSVVYRKVGAEWTSVLDVSQLDYPPLPEEYNIDRKALEGWMASKGRKQAISGVLLNQAQSHAAIALGANMVGWFDLENKQCRGWLAVGHGTRFGKLLTGGDGKAVMLALSPDETRLAFRPPFHASSTVFWFRLPDLLREAYVYNRDFPISAVSFSGDSRMNMIFSNGKYFSPNDAFLRFFRSHPFYAEEDRAGWFPERGEMLDLPYADAIGASFSANGNSCCVLVEGGEVHVGSGSGISSFAGSWKVVRKDVVDVSISNQGVVCLLTTGGVLHLYDMQSYTFSVVPFDQRVANLCKGSRPDTLLVGLGEGKENLVQKVDLSSLEAMKIQPLKVLKNRSICCDPLDRFYAIVEGSTGTVYRLETGEKELQFSSIWLHDDGPSSRIRFDDAGEFFYYGGDLDAGWCADMRVYKTATWSNVLSITHSDSKNAHFSDVVLDRIDGQPRLLLTRGGVSRFESLSIDPVSLVVSTNWIKSTGSSPLAIIPFSDPASGKRKYWCKLWSQNFQLYDAETGETSAMQNHWVRTGIENPEFSSKDPRVVFPMEKGQLQIALKSDLYPVFDPRIVDFKVEKAVLNCDASRLYLLGKDGKLRCMKLPALKQ
ncbi:serine/threonine protein kinase [Pontiella desulfatans]|nr:protein kinase [Pontiella desulfatans]